MATIETDLHLRIWGEGRLERVVLLHGSNVPNLEQIWQAQRPLADEFELGRVRKFSQQLRYADLR